MADAQILEQPGDGTPNPTEPTQQAEPTPQKEGAKRTTIFEDVGVDEPDKPGSTTWPDTWRESIAEAISDPKAGEALKRYQSPAEMAKALLAAQQKIRSGEYKRAVPLPEGADEAAVKAWREEQGLPSTPDDYKVPTLAGVDFENLDEVTRSDLNEFRTAAHGTNMTQAQADAAMGVAIKLAERQMERQAEADAMNMDRLDDTLRAEWGREFKQNLKTTHAWMNQQFGDATDAILLARMPDGQRVVDNPAFLKAMSQAARGSGSDVFVDEGGSQPLGLEGRRAEIEAIMRSDFGRYQRELEPEYNRILTELDKRGKL
jgi:hypothetical protein